MKFLSIPLLLCSLLLATSSAPLASAKDLSLEQSLLLSRAHAHKGLRAHSRGLHRIPRASLSAHRRATQLQQEQAQALASWDESFHEMNAKWQAAAQAALNKGETPPTFDEFAKENGFDTTPNTPQEPQQASAPAAATPKQAVQQQSTTSAPAAATNSNDNSSADDEESCDATDAADEGDEEDCSDDSDDDSSSSSSSTSAASTPKSTSAPPKATSSPPSNSGSSSTEFSGKATFYDPSVGPGSCGQTMQKSDYIIALNIAQMQASYGGANPNLNPLCGRKVDLKHNGKTVQATITDTCPGCQGANSVDMSPSLFDALATDYERTTAQSFTVDWSFA